MDHGNGTFSTETSEFCRCPTQTDPWNRPLPTFTEERDEENELVSRNAKTTVSGTTVRLVIFND